jgi:ATP-binding cassette subfamily B protein/subfamily B ATP-binding cassette protein MsbA
VAGERPALENVSFDIPAGKMTALVGPSGAGKSTVADMLMRLYDPTSGCILADGNDLRELRVASWRSRIGTVSQDAYMFNDTIRNNIALGNPRATDDDIRQAARAAMADEFISGLENGYDTVVGDRGYRISGGQRQRIAIARALLRKPEILVFDEATSSLDSGSERMIVEAIDRIRKDHTVLVIAHRLSTIAGADNIVVLDRGGLVESGQHGELVRADGEYSQLWRFQTEGTART